MIDINQRNRFWNNILDVPEPNCWLWQGSLTNGYGYFKSSIGTLAHRFSWTLYNGRIPKGLCVLHKCDVLRCVNPNHLFLGTRADNNLDRDLKGRQKINKHENHPMAKLTWKDVHYIRNARALGASFRQLAKQFNVDDKTIYRAVNGQCWLGSNK